MSHEEEEQRVIEDWRDALENLSTNARHEIISLTSIARDYTSYAYGISESLEEHIKKVGASARRLPRLPRCRPAGPSSSFIAFGRTVSESSQKECR